MLKLNDKQIEIITNASDKIDVAYDKEIKDGSIDENLLVDMIEELTEWINKMETESWDYHHMVDDYYEPKKIDPYDYYGVSEEDFY